jgi:hypothetical protein
MKTGFLLRTEKKRPRVVRAPLEPGDSKLERFIAASPSLWTMFLAPKIHRDDLSMLRMTSRTLYDAVARFINNEDAFCRLGTIQLYAGREAQMDPFVPVESFDADRERWWREKVARGELARWGYRVDVETMIETIKRPPWRYGDVATKHRIRYLRNVFECEWNESVTDLLLEKKYVTSYMFCVSHGCPVIPRPRRTYLRDKGVDIRSVIEMLKRDFGAKEVTIGEDRRVNIENFEPEKEKTIEEIIAEWEEERVRSGARADIEVDTSFLAGVEMIPARRHRKKK